MFTALRKTAAVAITAGCILTSVAGAASADQQVNVYVNQSIISSDQPAYLEEATGTTYVPLRAAAEALGGKVNWNNDTRVITLERNGKIIKLQIGSDKVLVNGKETVIGAPVKLAEETGRTLAPFRFFSDVLQCEVKVSATAGVGIFDEFHLPGD